MVDRNKVFKLAECLSKDDIDTISKVISSVDQARNRISDIQLSPDTVGSVNFPRSISINRDLIDELDILSGELNSLRSFLTLQCLMK